MSQGRAISVVLAIASMTLAGCPASSTLPEPGDAGDASLTDGAAHDASADGGAQDAGMLGIDGGVDAGAPIDGGGTDAAVTSDAGIDGGPRPDAGACTPPCGLAPHECCNGTCVYTYNDPMNCGSCGHACAATEYCTGGTCEPLPCTTTCGSGLCCGDTCCGAGEICCDPAGPLSRGPQCTVPDASGTCPAGCAPLCVCASPDTLIATPNGERPIADLVAGDLVYSAEGGALVAVPLAGVNRTWVGGDHRIVRVVLDTGRVLEISRGHPTADGRFFSDLRAGDLLDGARVVSAELVPYAHDYTYDVLPASDTATYVAGGVLIGSTLAPEGAPIALATDAE